MPSVSLLTIFFSSEHTRGRRVTVKTGPQYPQNPFQGNQQGNGETMLA
jgi:hypothetical protein